LSRLKPAFCVFVLLAGLAALWHLDVGRSNLPVIRSDGEGYYAYLPAVFLHRDITMRTLVEDVFRGHPPAGVTRWGGSRRYLDKYPAGEAMLLAPFFGFGSLAAALSGYRLNGYSPPFQQAVALAGVCYLVIGLSALWSVLARHFRPGSVAAVLFVVVFGTNLFHYATFDAAFSHVYSFFLFSVFLWIVERLYREARWAAFIGAGLVGGVIVTTRPTNGLWLVFAILFGITSRQDARRRRRFWRIHAAKVVAAVAVGVAVLGIQMGYWRAITGSFVVNAYEKNLMDFTRPHVLDVLFSVRKGLFFWSPVLVGVLPGLWYARRSARDFVLPMAVFLPLHVYLVSSARIWWYGGSFGQRPFVEALPLFAIALCALYEAVESPWWRRGLLIAFVAAAALSNYLMFCYWEWRIPVGGPDWAQFVSLFGWWGRR